MAIRVSRSTEDWSTISIFFPKESSTVLLDFDLFFVEWSRSAVSEGGGGGRGGRGGGAGVFTSQVLLLLGQRLPEGVPVGSTGTPGIATDAAGSGGTEDAG